MFPKRGIQLQTFSSGNPDYWFNGQYGLAALKEMAEHVPDCNYVYLDAFINVSDTGAARATSGYRGEVSLAAAINEAHTLGLNVCLRVQTNGADYSFLPSNPALFFQNYTLAVAGWAAWAESLGVEMFIVSAELTKLEAYIDEWNTLIGEVRKVFTGEVAYSTNWPNSQLQLDAKYAATWFQNLDVLVISAYPNLLPSGYTGTPSVAQIEAGWHSFPTWGGDPAESFKGADMAQVFQSISAACGKHVVFHWGLGSFQNALATPWIGNGSPSNLQLQDNAYQAFFNVFGGQYWVDGWLLDGAWLTCLLSQKSADNGEFTIQGKPSMATVQNGFAGLSPPPPPPGAQSEVRIDIDGEGSTDPTAGIHPSALGSTLYVTAFPAEGWHYVNMRRNEVDWTTANPGEFLDLTASEVIEVVFQEDVVPPPPPYKSTYIAYASGVSQRDIAVLRVFGHRCLPNKLIDFYDWCGPHLARLVKYQSLKNTIRRGIEWLTCQLKQNLTL
jgi:hypothetical protein